MKAKQKTMLIRIIIASVLLIAVAVSPITGYLRLALFLIPYFIVGYDILLKAAKGFTNGRIFDENLLMTVATLGAIAIALYDNTGDYTEAVAVMLFYQIGEWFQGYAVGKSRKNISELMDIRPDYANIEKDGQLVKVDPDEVQIGDIIVVQPGEKVPIDGVVIEGESSLNTSALTGESLPRSVTVNDEITSGCINLSGLLKIRTTKLFGDSTVSQILELVENASSRKSRSEAFITRFARVYTPVVVMAALLLALVPPLFSSAGFSGSFATWLHRALIFLVVSCPCALVISVPLTFFSGLGGASRKGILIKGSCYMDSLAKIGTVVFDKTGTLTKGEFAVEAVHPEDFNENELLHLAAHVEHFSTHPIGEALRAAFPNAANDGCSVTDVEEIAGQGIRACVEGHFVCVGNTKMMNSIGAAWHDCHRTGTVIHVAVDSKYAGHIVINDQLKEDSAEAVTSLKRLGVSQTVMLTGDREDVARDVAVKLGIDTWYAGLLPADKVKHLEQLLATKQAGRSLAFVGDGINDAPVLKRADIGIAMGGLGSDAAIEAADVVLMDDKPTKIATAISISRCTIHIARQNVWFAIGVKAAILILATVGLGTMWLAVFADVGVTVLAVLNAMRALRIPQH